MPEPDFLIKRGDTASSLYATLEDANGNAVNIQNAQVRFKMAALTGGVLTIDASATNAQNGTGGDGTLGNVVYSWGTHTSTAGRYLGEWEVTYAGGSVQTFPNGGYVLIDIEADLR